MQGQVLFIVWRESVEALLVVGIIAAWLRAHPEAVTGRKYMWAGIATGLLAAFEVQAGSGPSVPATGLACLIFRFLRRPLEALSCASAVFCCCLSLSLIHPQKTAPAPAHALQNQTKTHKGFLVPSVGHRKRQSCDGF